jgi:hypothetical protein
MPSRARKGRAAAVFAQSAHSFVGWRMAASVLLSAVVGAAGGWFGQKSQAPNLDSTQTAFFNVPAATRGAGDCAALRLAPDTRFAVLRVPGVSRSTNVVAMDAEKREIPPSRYASRLQPDGSHLVRMDTQVLTGREIFLEGRGADGIGEPLGCITGEVAPGR